MTPPRHPSNEPAPAPPAAERAPDPVEPVPAPANEPAPARARRRRALLAGGALAALAAVALGVHLFLTRGDQETDDAQVEADVVAIAPRVGGAVLRVLVRDDQQVKRGDLLFELDPADYQARVDQAEAELATAQAQAAAADAQVQVVEATARGGLAGASAAVSSSAASVQAAQAQVLAARAALRRAQAEAHKAGADLARARQLRQGDAIAQAQLDTVEAAAQTADANVAAARAQVAAAEEAQRVAQGRVGEARGKLSQSTPIEAQIAAAHAGAELAHARVRGAQAALELARLQLSYTRVAAPRDGQISRLVVREGQLVAPAQPVAQLVPDQTYLVANFKETQLGAIRPGQPVDVSVDAYGGRKLHGRVESISGGTGARFSLLPPDNASGNFVKVVERVPVRIAWVDLPPGLRLRAGLSADVTVHTRG
jgi:membrane fusion protein, multidrug efflux system